MDLKEYRERKQQLANQEKKFRTLCLTCFQPEFSCYCPHIQSFDPKIKFVILIHPIEVKRRIATGRMSHLCLQNSHLIEGEEFKDSVEVNSLLNDSNLHPMILYPGRFAANLSERSETDRACLFQKEKTPTIFVIDGTWTTAKKMLHRSPNLQSLQQICFSPREMSRFRVRKQPAENCVSTIEAIHETIDLMGSSRGFDTSARSHDNLLRVFDLFVEQQLACIEKFRKPRQGLSYRRVRSA